MSIDRDSLVEILEAVPFDPGRWVAAGSAPMLMAGLLDEISDLDIVVDDVAWRQAIALADQPPREGLFGDHTLALKAHGVTVEIFDGWLGIAAEEIIGEADEMEGFGFMPLERVVESKRRLGRPKDLEHLELILGPPRASDRQSEARGRGSEAD